MASQALLHWDIYMGTQRTHVNQVGPALDIQYLPCASKKAHILQVARFPNFHNHREGHDAGDFVPTAAVLMTRIQTQMAVLRRPVHLSMPSLASYSYYQNTQDYVYEATAHALIMVSTGDRVLQYADPRHLLVPSRRCMTPGGLSLPPKHLPPWENAAIESIIASHAFPR
ncbi:hypothetical protein AFLA_005449 [Aspergillus flavus NRRL3357]|nr:hypothetical protein AFLA_005449 [Aspergillus flavus NRRL3357]